MLVTQDNKIFLEDLCTHIKNDRRNHLYTQSTKRLNVTTIQSIMLEINTHSNNEIDEEKIFDATVTVI
jgi:hypothetical protein